MIYFDNNATTTMSADTISAMVNWCNQGNPSSGYASAVRSRQMMDDFRRYLLQLCQCDYEIIFTSGASEANAMIITGIIKSYSRIKQVIPHVVISNIEHKSLHTMIENMTNYGEITSTFVNPTTSGHILPADIESAITLNTCVVICMHANNETGAINNITAIGAVAHGKNVPFHCDTVQTFGKFQINPNKYNVDSFCISFHKFGGPPGVGALIVKKELMSGYEIMPIIYGTQNNNMRGGTENLPGIGASFYATKLMINDRNKKNIKCANIRNRIIDNIAAQIPIMYYTDYVSNSVSASNDIIVVIFTGDPPNYLGNTLFLSVVKLREPYVCNVKLKNALESAGIVISVGSACNTSSDKASHVLYALGADEYIRKGALRISVGDNNSYDEADIFAKKFVELIKLC